LIEIHYLIAGIALLMIYNDIALHKRITGKFGGYLNSWKNDLRKLI